MFKKNKKVKSWQHLIYLTRHLSVPLTLQCHTLSKILIITNHCPLFKNTSSSHNKQCDCKSHWIYPKCSSAKVSHCTCQLMAGLSVTLNLPKVFVSQSFSLHLSAYGRFISHIESTQSVC